MLYHDGDEIWDYDAVDTIVKEYGCDTEYNRLCLRFGLMELATGGMLECVEEQIDEKPYFKKDSVVCKYKITEFGLDRIKVLE